MNDLNMKRCLLLSVCVLLISLGAWAQEPDWIRKPPKAKNNTYSYVVAKSNICYSEGDARRQAIANIFYNTGMRLGMPVDIAEINRAVQRNSSFEVLSSTFNIPINKVCEYSERLNSGNYIVYVLCQVAEKGNIEVRFTHEFRDCYTTQEFKNGNALLKSMFIPGLGQIGKRHYVEGTLTLIGEVVLVGAGTVCYLSAQDKLDIMHSDNVSYTDFSKARDDYNMLKDASYVIWGTAAGLYVFNLIRAYTMKPNYKRNISFCPTILPDNERVAPGLAVRVKF